LAPIESASAKLRVFDFLRALDLAPHELQHAIDQAKGNNPYVGDVIDEVMDRAWPWSSCFLPATFAQLRSSG